MPQLDLDIVFIGEAESRALASRQLLSFLRVPTEAGPGSVAASKVGFLLSALPEGAVEAGPGLFKWATTELFDVDGRLVFRDQTLELGGAREIRVRTAVSDFLRSPVWSVSSGPKLALGQLVDQAVAAMKDSRQGPLRPLLTNGEIRIIVYSYPKLGIRAVLDADQERQFIVDIGDHSVIPVEAFKNHSDSEDVVTVWSPYDTVVSTTVGKFRALWLRNLARLPELPEAGTGLEAAVSDARAAVVEEKSVNPEILLVGQETDVFCAVATGQMILKHHGIAKTQKDIAAAMQTGTSGTTNDNQQEGYRVLSQSGLLATLDETASFEEGRSEVLQNRPFKSGITGHARACAGYKLEAGGKKWLYILDPWPPKQGAVYYEDWDAMYHTNYMYVRPALFA